MQAKQHWTYIGALGLLCVLFVAGCAPRHAEEAAESQAAPATATAPASPTVAPAPTVAQIPSSTPEPLMEGPLLAIVGFAEEDHNMYLLDTTQGFVRWLHFEEGHPLQIQWIEDGCQLYVTLIVTSSNFKVVCTDLEGNVLEEIAQYPRVIESSEDHDVWRKLLAVPSPTGDWLASPVVTGKLDGSKREFVEIEVISTREEGKRYILSSGGGAADIAWSPDGQRLAYSDYDASGIRQLYTSSLDGTGKVQLTHFTQPDPDVPLGREGEGGLSFSDPVWSPNGRLLAFHYWLLDVDEEDHSQTGSVWIVSASGDRQIQIVPADLPAEPIKRWSGSIIGWSEDSTRLAFKISLTLQDEDEYRSAVYWVDATDGSVLHVLNGSEMPEGYVSTPFPVGRIETIVTRAGSGWDLYLYDSLTGSLEYVPVKNQPDLLHFEYAAVASPYNFPGEAACKAQSGIQAP